MRTKLLFVLSLCGTSLLTNQADDAERKLVSKYANTKNFEEIPPEDLTKLQLLTERVQKKVVSADVELASKMSAELNGIIKLYDAQFDNSHDHHILISTDTWLGKTTAEFVAQWLENKGLTVERKPQVDLQTKDITSFQYSLSEIVRWCESTIPDYRKSRYHVVFNLTGGFKSVQGFFQTLATFYADETIYIFETAKELIRIPRLPVEMAAEETVCQNLEVFRRLSMELTVSEVLNIPETLVMNIYEKMTLSPWGEIVWEQTKRKIYANKLHPSPSRQLEFSSKFNNSLEKMSPDRFRIINERIDQIAKYLETKGQYNPPSLDFKQLKGNPCPPSTHEVDAWADRDAKRIFGHYDNGRFILDKLDRALH